MYKSIGFLSFTFLLTLGSFAFAQSPTDTLNAKQKDILKMLKASGGSEGTEVVLDQMFDSFKQFYSSVPDNWWEEMKNGFDVKELQFLVIPIYDKHFTHEEVKALIAFYESPIGRKFALTLPKITQEAYVIGQAYGKRVAEEVMNKLKEDGY